jgi:hypothetical protein
MDETPVAPLDHGLRTVTPSRTRTVSRWLAVHGALLFSLTCPSAVPASTVATAPADAAEQAGKVSWEFGISVNGYFLPDQVDYVQPTVTVDHGWLHLEGRYNYEAMRTGSLWAGWNFAWGESPGVAFTLTPMLGGIFGDVNGMAPGVKWDLTWGPLEFYSESECVFDFANSFGSYFYSWSEMVAWPFEWLRAGLALQRSRAIESSRFVQWGAVAGVEVWKLNASAYWFNPGQADAQYWVASLGASF